MSKLGIPTNDHDRSLLQLQEMYAIRVDDLLLIFINNVQEDPSNSCNYIKDFDAFYFTKRPRFSSQLIRLIIFGSQDQQQYEAQSDWTGLFGLFSQYNEFFLTASSAVQLVAKLIDYTKNVYAEAFNKELGRTNPEYLSRFCLE